MNVGRMNFGLSAAALVLSMLAGTCHAQTLAGADAGLTLQATATPAAPTAGSTLSPTARFLLSDQRFFGEPEVLWPGFLNGLRGFEHVAEPIGNPIYFESPFINTNIRLLYLHHNFPNNSGLQGGDLNVIGAQARLALTERLAFIAPKDGYSWLRTGVLPNDDGWNDITVGAKYALIVDRESRFVLTPGFRWEWSNGNEGVLQGGCQEFSPFVSVAKSWGELNVLGNITYRIPEGGDEGNQIFSWDIHFDADLEPLVGIKGIAPVIEFHGIHYLTNGNRFPLRVGGMDYNNLGTQFVAGTATVWTGMGFRFKFSPNASLGCTYEIPLTSQDRDILENRVSVDLVLSW